MASGASYDDSDFKKKIDKISKKEIPRLIEVGLAKAAMTHLNHCVMISPTVPIKEGWLRGSGSIFVNNRFIAESNFGKKKFATRSHTEARKKAEHVAVIGFNTPYAKRLHESFGFKFSEPSAGSKFVSRKLQQFKDIYISIMASTIKGKK